MRDDALDGGFVLLAQLVPDGVPAMSRQGCCKATCFSPMARNISSDCMLAFNPIC